jgi:hypothetical protein
VHGQQLPFERYKVPPTCNQITTNSGSNIFIEDGALIAKNDSVEIIYREFTTTVDMILHQINMHTSFGTDHLQLESSGMFEIYVLDGEDTLMLQPGKRINVQMAINELMPRNTQGYRYNQQTKSWDLYRPEVRDLSFRDDNELWGSSEVNNEEIGFEEGFDFDGGFGVNDPVRQEIFQSMEIADFGLFNYDKILGGVEYQYLSAGFSSDKKEKIESTIYVVYEGINSVFYFPKYTWDKFFLIKGKAYKLFTIVDENQVLVLESYPDLASLPAGKIQFVLKKRPSEDDTRTTLTQLLIAP